MLATPTPTINRNVVYITFINSGRSKVSVSWEVTNSPLKQVIQVSPGAEEFYGFEAGKEYEIAFQKKKYAPYKEK